MSGRTVPTRGSRTAVPPSGAAETLADGYRLSGRWHYSSGCEHADWLILGARVPIPGAEPADKVMLVPRDQVDVEDTWHVTGMRGTGSNTVVANGVTVPFPPNDLPHRGHERAARHAIPGRGALPRPRSCWVR